MVGSPGSQVRANNGLFPTSEQVSGQVTYGIREPPPDLVVEAVPERPEGREALRRPSPPIVAAHVATLVSGFAVWMYLDRHLWFYGDEWDFIVGRGVFHGQLSIWAPHNEHWSTLPILVWRAIFSVVHLGHYWPYLAALLLVHIGVVHLLWRRCLLEGVDAWVATAMGLLLALLGSAAEDLTWAFQIGFLGSLAFGLIALELVEHRGPTVATSVGAVLAAVASLMCSDVGLAMLAALAILAVARRGWRQATLVVAPPTLAFAVWFVLVGRTGIAGDPVTRKIILGIPSFVWQDVRADTTRILSLASYHVAFLAPWLVIGLVTWVGWGGRRLYRRYPVVFALLAGDVVFHILTALGRERLSEAFSPSRYVYIDAVFLLPVLGIAVGWRSLAAGVKVTLPARVIAVGLLIAFTVGNVHQGAAYARSRTSYVLMLKSEIEGSAQLLASGQGAIAVHPISWANLTPQGMLSLERRGLLPKLRVTKADRATDETILEVTVSRHRLVTGRFAPLLLSHGVTMRITSPGCLTMWARGRARSAQLVLGLPGTERSAAVHFTGAAMKILAFLTPGLHREVGEGHAALNVPAAGAWVSDAEPRDNLLLDLPSDRGTFCDLSSRPSGRGNLALAQHRDADENAD